MSLTRRACSFFLIGLCLTTTAHAQSASSINTTSTRATTHYLRDEWSGTWRLGVGGESFEEGRDEGMAAYVRGNAKLTYRFNDWFKARIDPRLKFYSSRTQARYADDTYRPGLRARNAYVSVTPTSWFEARGGAVSQSFISSPTLISRRRSFPSVQEIFTLEPLPKVQTQLVLQQAVPTSSSMNAERAEREPLPYFQTQSVHVRGRNLYWLDYDANVGHFNYSRLPDKVAFESAVLGNTVPGGQAAAGSRFMYGFDGYFAGAEVLAGEGPLRVKGEYRFATNRLAPSDSADTQYWLIGPQVKIGEALLRLNVGQYFVESDATVASYTQAELGFNNRVGDILLSRLEFPKQNFALKLEWVSSRVLAPVSTQQSMTSILFGVETDYASF